MQYIVSGPPTSQSFTPEYTIEKYTYPEGLDLRPSSDLHRKLVQEVLFCANDSRNYMQNRFDSWKEIEKTLTAYVHSDEAEKKVQSRDSRKPVSIVVPMSYAILDTLLTYMTAAFFEHPIFKYSGSGSEDIIGAMLIERVVDLHVRRNKVLLALHTQFRDAFSYGFGVTSPVWKEDWGYKVRPAAQGFLSGLGSLFGKSSSNFERELEESLLFEGNALVNIDPRRYLPDPNVPIHDVQAGEFVGWVERTNVMRLLEEERRSEDWFNVQYLDQKKGSLQSQFFGTEVNEGRDKFGMDAVNNAQMSTRPCDLLYMYRNIVPKRYGLSDVEYPEKWLFVVAADCIVVQARPLGLAHNRYPATVIAPDYDGYSASPVSRLEMVSGMQGVVNWFFNSHIANVRKALNDMLIVDPSLVNMHDLANPEPGKLVRLRRSAWGKGIDSAIKQLSVSDVTRNHISDLGQVTDMMQRVSGAVDQMQGINRQGGERVSAAESQGVRSSALSRLEKLAKIAYNQGMYDTGYMFAVHTQQLLSQEMYVEVAGRYEEELRATMLRPGEQRMRVSPLDILVDVDLVMHDGSAPGNEDTNSWVQVMQAITANPQIAQIANLDLGRIFTHVFRQLGARNISDFKLTPDEQVKQQIQMGNIIPIGEGAGNAGGPPIQSVGS